MSVSRARIKLSLIAVFACSLITNNCLAELRTWTSANGKTIQAEMISADNQSVQLKYANGKTGTVKLSQLSKEDQAYIASQKNSSSPSSTVKGNFNAPWPKATKGLDDYIPEVIKEGPDEYIYETPHFQFIADAPIATVGIKKISMVFEATYLANKDLPLGNIPWYIDGDVKFSANLIASKSKFNRECGMENAAGVFKSRTGNSMLGTVIVPFDTLSLKLKGKKHTVDRDNKNVTTLIHEITHQMTPDPIREAASWICEGTAQYVELSPYSYESGRFSFNNKRSVIANVTAYGRDNQGGRNLGKEISMPDLKSFMTMPYRKFVQPSRAHQNYAVAVLLTYYFYHADGKGDAAQIKEYFKALVSGENEPAARKHLLNGRTYDQLAKDVSDYWRKNGITLTFAPSNEE